MEESITDASAYAGATPGDTELTIWTTEHKYAYPCKRKILEALAEQIKALPPPKEHQNEL